MGIFKKKNPIEREQSKEIKLLSEYIIECRNRLFDDLDIIKKFREKKYPEDIIIKAFEIANQSLPLKQIERRDNRMAKKPEYDEEDEEEFEEEDEDDDEEDEEEQEEVRPKKKIETRGRPSKEKKSEKTSDNTDDKVRELANDLDNQLNQILTSHEQRIQAIEAALFRVRGSI